MNEVLKMTGITKTFPGVYALDGVDLELYRGEVLALLGENGAGKSTLLKVLSGVYTPDAGEIYVNGTKKVFKEPADAAAEGIRIIYQEINSYDELTVAENIFVNNEPKKGGLVDWKEMNSRAEALLKRLNVDIEPTRIVGGLSTAQKQLIEIARALANDIRILVMDEPTSALSDTEVDALLKLVKELAKEGISVIYISHKLDELYTVATRVQIMRDGKRVGVRMLAQTPQEELVRLMVGREIRDMYPKVEIPQGETVLEVQNLTNQKIQDISFEVHAGEILGIFGLMGAGRTELCKAIFGAAPVESGEIRMHGKRVKIQNVSDAKKCGLAYLPNDRKAEGLLLQQTIRDNFASALIDRFTVCKGLIVDNQAITKNAENWVKKLNVSTPTIYKEAGALSGGNQQKVVVGKWLETNPDVIILNEPTRGIDVGAKVEIYTLMEELCKDGMAVVFVSSEQAELFGVADRIVVLSEGKKTGELTREQFDAEKLMQLAIGGMQE